MNTAAKLAGTAWVIAAVVAGVLLTTCTASGPASVPPVQDAPDPRYLVVGSLVEIAALPADARFVAGSNLDAAGLAALGRLTRLEGLRLRGCAISEPLPLMPVLQRLDLSRCGEFSQEFFGKLRESCFGLRELDLSHNACVDDRMVASAIGNPFPTSGLDADPGPKMPLLSLDVSHCPRLTVATLHTLQRAGHVREVRLDGAAWLTLVMAEGLTAGGMRVRCVKAAEPGFDAALQALALPLRYVEVWSLAELEALPDDATHVACRELGDIAALRLLGRPGLLGLKFVDRSHGTTFHALPRDRLTAIGLANVKKLTRLEELSLDGVHLNGESLAGLKSLRVLQVGGYDVDLRFLPELPALRVLRVDPASRVGERDMQGIAGCRGLKSLSMSFSPPLESGHLARLGALVGLEELELTDCGDEAMLALPPLPNLHTLRLGSRMGKLRGDGLAALARFPGLRKLCLSNCEVGNLALSHLPVTLQELQLTGCNQLTPEAGRLLRDCCPALHSLTLGWNCWLDDGALAAILELPVLATLNLHDCRRLSAKWVSTIRSARALRRLGSADLFLLMPELLEQLRTDRPDLVVDVGAGSW